MSRAFLRFFSWNNCNNAEILYLPEKTRFFTMYRSYWHIIFITHTAFNIMMSSRKSWRGNLFLHSGIVFFHSSILSAIDLILINCIVCGQLFSILIGRFSVLFAFYPRRTNIVFKMGAVQPNFLSALLVTLATNVHQQPTFSVVKVSIVTWVCLLAQQTKPRIQP